MLTVYAFGNGYLLYGMFQAIALFFNFNNVGVLFTILAMIAVIYYGIRVTMFHQGSLLSTSKYFLAFFIILSVLVYNKTTVLVNDVSNPTAVTNAEPINNVPWGVAELWSGFTNIQYALATDFTTAFSTPTGDNLLNMGVGVSIVQQEDSAMISTANSYLFQDYNEYISNCVAPGISAGDLNVSDLLAAGNATDTASQTYGANQAGSIWTVMSGFTSNTATGGGGNMLTEWYSGSGSSSDTYLASGTSAPNGTSTTCANETTWLNSAIQNYYIPNNLGPSMAGELQFASWSVLSNALGQMNPYILNMQQTGNAQLMQAIGVNMYAPAILKMAQTSGASASSLAVATGMGTVSTQQGMLESGIMAGRYMPIVFGIFEALALGASVLILILTITHMGVKYLKLLFEILIMITIWPSLTAVFNYVSQLIIQAQYQPLSGLGYSVSGSGEISSFLASSLAWMGYFSWSVPMMAYAIASGSSYAMTSMVGGMDSAISKNASVRGAEAGLGNMTAGQIKDNNYMGNKFDAVNTMNTGYAARKFTNEYTAPQVKTEELGNTGMWAHISGNSATITQGKEGATVATAEKGLIGSHGGWGITSVNDSFKGVLTDETKASISTDLTNEEKSTVNKIQSIVKGANADITARNTYDAQHGFGYHQGKIQTTGTFNATKQTSNITADKSNTSNKGTTASVSAGGYIPLTKIGGTVKGSTSIESSNSINSSRGTSNSAGATRNLKSEKATLETLSHSHDRAVAADATKKLAEFDSLTSSLTKIQDIKKKLAETKSGNISVGADFQPATLNAMRGGSNSLTSIGEQLFSFTGSAATPQGVIGTVNNLKTAGNNNYKPIIPNVNPEIEKNTKKLNNLTKNLTHGNVNAATTRVKNEIAGNYKKLVGGYRNLLGNVNVAISKPLPSIGAVGTGIGAPHISNPLSPVNKAGHFVATGVDEGLGVLNGTTVATIGIFSQSAASSLYTNMNNGASIFSNPSAYKYALNLASHGNINLANLSNLANNGASNIGNFAVGQYMHPFGLTAPGEPTGNTTPPHN
ncbi:MAG: conjugal transfer protein TraG N-terminal domain-containing protein [bacterium]